MRNMKSGKSLVLSISEFDSDPSGSTTWVTLDVEASSGFFSGASACILVERDLIAFLDAVDSVAETAKGEALLRGGWGSTEDVRLRVFPSDRRGHLAIHAILGEVPDHERRSRLEVFFETEPQPLLRVTAALRLGTAEREPGEFRVFVDGGPAA